LDIKIRGASENNLKAVDVDISDGLTVVTGVSGSGKTSLVFDTLYHEAQRRFLEVFSTGSQAIRLAPANVQSVTGIGPAVAVGQNLLNRNPLSTLATASGLHPFLRLLYARFGKRYCPNCGTELSLLTEDEIIEQLLSMSRTNSVTVFAPLVKGIRGSHRTLLTTLANLFNSEAILVDGKPWQQQQLKLDEPHDIEIEIAKIDEKTSAKHVREIVQKASALEANAIIARSKNHEFVLSRVATCINCGTWFGKLDPVHFHMPCPHCHGKGCEKCAYTGLYPDAANVRWMELRLTDLLALSVDEVQALFTRADLPSSAARLGSEIERRLESLVTVGLGYIQLDRPSPTLSRGESQRARLAVALTSRLEDVLHVLDEPTIGQHPSDVARILPAFRKLLGPVVYVEHDRAAAAAADQAVDIGPGAGDEGGRIVFAGTPAELWEANTFTGRHFSFREQVPTPEKRPAPERFLVIRGAYKNNLRNIDVPIPIGRLTVITGVSGSGKSTFVEEVLVPSLQQKKKPVGCKAVEGSTMKPVLVDQGPIGKNPRSNPATYTKLSDIVRDLFSNVTGLSSSYFSFNRPEGACKRCDGIGAVEVKMRYLPSTWVTCSECDGQRFSDEVLSARVSFGNHNLSIADFYKLSISEVNTLLTREERLSTASRRAAKSILDALVTIGLGYMKLGQPSPTLSGGEAQRVKLAKYLGKRSLSGRLLVLDEPSTGLHPKDLAGMFKVLDRLVRVGATVVVVEHNTDVVRAADWVVDLGPGAGPKGGEVIYAGPPDGLTEAERSLTGRALREEASIRPKPSREKRIAKSKYISIRSARANNLKNVNIDFQKSALTVVTGVSGSGKSSLVHDVLEAEARRRFLETLSMYERQGVHEGPEAPVESVSGLGVSVSVMPERRLYSRRSTVGTATEIWHHLAVLLASVGERTCLKCGAKMERGDEWSCSNCGSTAPIAKPRHFSSSTYSAACPKCHGVGTFQVPAPEKLIVNPEKPLCSGAMYSPGFFPKGYLCKPYNGG
jgi:excinuclease ABC subunit A